MLNFFTNLRLMQKFWLVVGIAVAGGIIADLHSLSKLRQDLIQDRKIKTEAVVETAYTVLEHFQSLANSGQMTTEAAQQSALKIIKAMRYEGKNYFWINDMTPTMVMHPFKPELDGQNIAGSKDPNGKALFVEMVDVVKRQGAGFVNYQWEKPGEAVPENKISFVKGFQPWGWIIGSGIYLNDVERLYWSELRLSLGILGSIVALSILLAMLLGRHISYSVSELRRVVERVTRGGDLSQLADIKGRDEMSQIGAAVNDLIKRFQVLVRDLSQASNQVTRAADDMFSVVADSVTGTRSQQQEINQAATAVNEMAASVEEVARNASEAAEAATEADEYAKNSKQVVQGNQEAISRLASEVESASTVIQKLETDSESIGKVLDVIRGVAEQTNLLALNAAIEAARAGDQGRGFAVVADEVRTLAQRTQASTTEIQDMVESLQAGSRNAVQVMESGQTQAKASVEQAVETGDALEHITEAVARITDLNVQIASAAEQQTKVTEEVNQNVVQINTVASQSVEAAGKVETASKELRALAVSLSDMVSQYSA